MTPQPARTRPARDRLTVQQRHLRIVELRTVGLTLEVIAREVSLTSHTSVIHHLNGGCRCGLNLGRLEACQHEYACKRCGATKSPNGRNGAKEAAAEPSGGDRV